MAGPTYRKTSADKSKALYDAGIPGSTPKLTQDKAEAERQRAEYDAKVVETGSEAAKRRGGITTSVFRLNAPDMPRRAVPAKSDMKPKPVTTPY